MYRKSPQYMKLGLGKPPPKLKLLAAQSTQLIQIPSLERQNVFVENVYVGDYLLFIFIVCFEK